MAWCYLLRCSDGSYYIGSTRNLPVRLHEHHEGRGAAYTRSRRPVTLVWAEEFENIGVAFGFEKQVQGWSRAKREALIRGDLEALPGLSQRRQRRFQDDG